MYVTNTTEKVRELFDKYESMSDLSQLKFFIYVFDLVDNKQINDKDVVNPDGFDDDELTSFSFQDLGFEPNYLDKFLQYYVMIYNKFPNTKEAYIDNDRVLGIDYEEDENNLLSQFGKLSFIEKLDVISELIILYERKSFPNIETTIEWDENMSSFDIAKLIQDYKNEIQKKKEQL